MAKEPDIQRPGPAAGPAPDSTHTLGDRLILVYGIVTDYTGGLNLYRVKISDGDEIVATALSEGGGLVGVRKNVGYPLNTPVCVAVVRNLAENASFGIILGSIPREVSNESMYQADADVIGSLVGWIKDQVHKWEATQRPTESQRKNFNNYLPIDALTGEWGMYSPLGPAIHLGMVLGYLRATDRCGIWAFRQDELLRLMAKNLEHHTFGRDYEDTFASGELLAVDNWALYPWEGLGAFGPQEVAQFDAEADPYSEEGTDRKLPLEPLQDRQRGIFRRRRILGYPGDLEQLFVTAPLGSGVDAYGQNEDQFPGVFRQVIGPDGSLVIQSAKGITIEKYLAIPYPIELRKPHDPQGDLVASEEGDSQTYMASGYYAISRGEEQEEEQGEIKRLEFRSEEEEETPARRAMLGLELHGHMAITTITNLLLHKQNWKVPEEGEHPLLEEGPAINIGPEFQLDPDKQWMPLPRVKEIDVDHRYPGCRYFASRAGINFLDDGSVAIDGGYGEQLLMSGGNMILSCPGDIMRSAGRSIMDLAPKDLIARAGRDVDVTSSFGDMRLKAEYNMMLIGANAGDRGGVLIESRNDESRGDFDYRPGVDADIQGLVLSNRQGAVAILGEDLALMAGMAQVGSTEAKLLLQTRGSIHALAGTVQVDAEANIDFLLGLRSEGEDQLDELLDRTLYQFGITSADFVQSGANLGPSLNVAGSITSRSLVSTGVSETDASALDELLATAQEGAFESAGETYQELLDARASSGTAEEGQGELENYLNAQVVANVRGSLRTDEDYGTIDHQNFRLWEFPWQQMARATGRYEGNTWEEPVVEHDVGNETTNTLPWPGYVPWTSASKLLRLKVRDENYFDMEAGVARAFDEEIDGQEDSRIIPEVEEKQLSDSFLVNFKPTSRG